MTDDFCVPNSTVRLRACLGCRLILPFTQFLRQGCPNCPNAEFLGDRSAVDHGTTKHFTGSVGVSDPARSWVARHLHVEQFVPGMYAILAGAEEEHQEDPDEYEEDVEGEDDDRID